MSRLQVAVLDFGSSKITVLVGDKGAGNLLRVKAKGMSDYAGFMDGEFLEPNALRNNIYKAISEAEKSLKKKIKRIYVGVPAEFSYNQCLPLELAFTSKTKIKQRHLNKLFAINKDKVSSQTSKVINKVPVYYTLDDGNKIVDPVACVSSSIKSYTSFILANNNFINLVSKALFDIGVNNFEFVSSNLVESLYLIEPETREKSAILIDCGFITTSVTHILSEGIIDLKSFSLGGGHITSDLSEVLSIPFYSAEQLKRKLVISLDAKPQDYYEAIVNNKITKFSAKTANDISLARIDMICEAILKSFEDFIHPIMPSVSVYLTGGGLSYIKGVKDYLSKYLNYDINILSPQPLQLSKPELSSEVSLLDIAITMENS